MYKNLIHFLLYQHFFIIIKKLENQLKKKKEEKKREIVVGIIGAHREAVLLKPVVQVT